MWQVIDNHAETIAGSGFALANRIVHSHVSGDLFAHSNALRLAPFFNALQGELAARAGRDDAAIALLTPGAHHEDYFGHAYLAAISACCWSKAATCASSATVST